MQIKKQLWQALGRHSEETRVDKAKPDPPKWSYGDISE